MTKKSDQINRLAFEFNCKAKTRMEEIGAPLEKYGITGFNYIRLYEDGKRIYWTDKIEWVDLYLKNNFQDDVDHLEFYAPQSDIKCALWSAFKKDKVFDALYNFNFWNGFTIYENHDGYVDTFDFHSSRENCQMVNFYLNNLKLLHDFVEDFKKKAADVINSPDQRGLIVPKNLSPINKIERTPYIKTENIHNFMQQTNRAVHL